MSGGREEQVGVWESKVKAREEDGGETGELAEWTWKRQLEFGEGKITRACIFKRLWSPGINSKECISPAYVAWRAGTITLFLLCS